MQPDCIILDEPTAMLDPIGRKEILETVHRLNREMGMTVVLITHHMNEAADAKRVVVMADGEILMDASPREIFANAEVLDKAGLVAPQTIELLQLLKEEGLDVSTDVLTPKECAQALYKLITK